MSEAKMEETTEPKLEIKHDGYKSRKFILSCVGAGILTAIGTTALFLDRMAPDQWIEFAKWIWLVTLVAYNGANTAEAWKRIGTAGKAGLK